MRLASEKSPNNQNIQDPDAFYQYAFPSCIVLPPVIKKAPTTEDLALRCFVQRKNEVPDNISWRAPLEKTNVLVAGLATVSGVSIRNYFMQMYNSFTKSLASTVKYCSEQVKEECKTGKLVFKQVLSHFRTAKNEATFIVNLGGSANNGSRVFFLTVTQPKWVRGLFTLPGLFNGSIIAAGAEAFEYFGAAIGAMLQKMATPHFGLSGSLVSYSIGSIVASTISMIGLGIFIGLSSDSCGCAARAWDNAAGKKRESPSKDSSGNKPYAGVFMGQWGLSFGLKQMNKSTNNSQPRGTESGKTTEQRVGVPESFVGRLRSLKESLPGLMAHLILHKLAEFPGVALGGLVAATVGGNVIVGLTIGNLLASFMFHITYEVYRHHRIHVIRRQRLERNLSKHFIGSGSILNLVPSTT
jgi:hypothetical protein